MDLDNLDLLDLQLMSYNPLQSVLAAIIARLKQNEVDMKNARDTITRQQIKMKKMETGQKKVLSKLNEKINDLKDRVSDLERTNGDNKEGNKTIIKEIMLNTVEKPKNPEDLTGRKSELSSRGSTRGGDDEKSRLSSRQSERDSDSKKDDIARSRAASIAEKEIEELLELDGSDAIGMTAEDLADLMGKTEDNKQGMNKLQGSVEDLNTRFENMLSMVRKATQIAKGADVTARDALKQAQGADSKAVEAKSLATGNVNNIKSNTERLDKIENNVFDLHKNAGEAKKLAERAAADAAAAKETAASVASDAEEALHAANDAHDRSKRNSKVSLMHDERLIETEKNIKALEKTLTTLGNSGDNEKLAELLASQKTDDDETNSGTSKRSPTPRGEFATRREVQLLRQVLVKCEGDITKIMEFIDALQRQAQAAADAAAAAAAASKKQEGTKKKSTKPRKSSTLTTTGSKRKKSKRDPLSARTNNSVGNLSARSTHSVGSRQSDFDDSPSTDGTVPSKITFTNTADTASGVLPRPTYNQFLNSTNNNTTSEQTNTTVNNQNGTTAVGPTINGLGGRDVRTQWQNNNTNNTTNNNYDKMYNTLAVTLNETLGRISVLEVAVTALQNLLDNMDFEGASMRSGDTASTNALATGGTGEINQEMMDKLRSLDGSVSADDFNNLVDKLNSKCDTSIVDNLMKQVQALLSQVRTLQRQVDTKASRDAVPTLKQFRDLENKIIKKVNRKELQTVVAKLLPKRNDSQIANFNNKNNSGDLKASEKAMEDIEKLKDAINAHAKDIHNLYKAKAEKGEVFKELSDYKEILDRHDQMKADASIVARKAEREYVDSALEKLKSELEGVVGQTNAHTSNLIAKDLEFLKGLLDHKASKAEVRKLRDLMKRLGSTERKTDGGLVGYRKLRCLSCNASMENMRTKPHAMNFMNFVSHLPDPKNRLYPKHNQIVDPLTQESLRTTHNMMRNQVMQQYANQQPSTTSAPHGEDIITAHPQHDEGAALPPIRHQ